MRSTVIVNYQLFLVEKICSETKKRKTIFFSWFLEKSLEQYFFLIFLKNLVIELRFSILSKYWLDFSDARLENDQTFN